MTCPDRVGVVATVTGFIASHGGWVLEAAQHGDLETGRFFQRIEVLAESLSLDIPTFNHLFAEVATPIDLSWAISDTEVLKKVVIFASRESHCVADLLHRHRSGDLTCDISAVIANHDDLRPLTEAYGVPFHVVPVGSADKDEAFGRMGTMLNELDPDVIVLARYMQIIPPDLCARYPGRIINIHHSFLPSFAGAKPYHQAFERGVKLIGATCHYVTPELDEGPIIEQDVVRVSHGDTVEDLVRMGRDVERTVLARGLRWHLEDRVLLNGRRTVVFP